VLGELKFAFPNKHTVYMHDTPTKALFDEASRPFSHGCMRVRNPRRMAEIMLYEDKGWDAAKIAELLATGPDNNEVPIDKKIGVHIT
jgi:L,D-transpeptidase YcbB